MAIGIEIKFEITKGLDYEKLPVEVRKKALRSSIRGAVAPIRAAMISITRSISKSSARKQGTGATSRSIDVKVGSPKGNPNVVYGIVGPDRRHVEFMANRPSVSRRGKFYTHETRQSFASDARKARKRYAVVTSLKKGLSKEVTSYYKRNRKKTSGMLKRRPSKYFHLLDQGFTHFKSGKNVPGKQIIAKVSAQSIVLAQQRFKTNMLQRIVQLLTK